MRASLRSYLIQQKHITVKVYEYFTNHITLFPIFQGLTGPMGSIGYPGPRGVKVSAILVIQQHHHPAMRHFHFA